PLTASVSATRRAIVRHVVRGAVDVYIEALRARAEAQEAFGDDEELDAMTEVVRRRVEDAERTLVRAVLSITPWGEAEFPVRRPELEHCPPRAAELDGRLYVVVPNPTVSEDMEPGEVARAGG